MGTPNGETQEHSRNILNGIYLPESLIIFYDIPTGVPCLGFPLKSLYLGLRV